MSHPGSRHLRLRYTATGALAALAAVGAIAGTAALADKPRSAAKTPALAAIKNAPPHQAPDAASNLFVSGVHRLVADGTLTAAEGQALDNVILAGPLDPQTLTSTGLTQTQLQAVERMLVTTKSAVAAQSR